MSELRQAVEQIREWFSKKAPVVVANLNAPVDAAALTAAQTDGFAISAELRELYLLHDGQPDWDGDFFLPNVGFLPLAAAKERTDQVLQDLFGCPAGHRTPPDQFKGHCFWHAEDEELFLPDEWTPDWFCFGENWDEFLVQHSRTGRVFLWPSKDFHCLLLGASLTEVLGKFARALHGGECKLSGDSELPEVEQHGFANRRRYVNWYPSGP